MNRKNLALSAVILAKNEEPRIDACIRALDFADEVIVIDNGSSDRTGDIARKAGAKVIPFSHGDFSALRQFGKDESRGEWILYIDADETVTTALREEITGVVKNGAAGGPVAYFIQRDNRYLGHPWPTKDKMQRLFLKASLIRWEGKLHETAIVDGATGILENPLIHDTHRNLPEMVAKTNVWSDIEAKNRFDAGHPPVSWWRLFRVTITGFSQSFFGQGGWKAGTVGWIESIFQGYSMFVTYAKLWELQHKK